MTGRAWRGWRSVRILVIEDSNSSSGGFFRPVSSRGGEGVPAHSSIVFRLGECVVCDFTKAAHADTDLNVQQKVQEKTRRGSCGSCRHAIGGLRRFTERCALARLFLPTRDQHLPRKARRWALPRRFKERCRTQSRREQCKRQGPRGLKPEPRPVKRDGPSRRWGSDSIFYLKFSISRNLDQTPPAILLPLLRELFPPRLPARGDASRQRHLCLTRAIAGTGNSRLDLDRD